MPAEVVPFPRRAGAYTGAKDEDAARVLRHVEDCHTAMGDAHEGWFYDIAFFRGDQWTYRDPISGRIQPIPVSPWRPRPKDNQTRPLVMHMLALLIERRPTYRAIARDEGEEDILAAHAYEALLTWDWERLELTEALSDVLLWTLITGNGFLRCAWNPMAGRPLLVPGRPGEDLHAAKDGPPPESKDATGAPGGSAQPTEAFYVPGLELAASPGDPPAAAPESLIYEGDVDVQVVSPFSIGVDIAATSLRNAAWLYQEAFVAREVLIDRLGSKARELTPDVSMDEFYAYDQQLRFDSGTAAISRDEASDQVRVIEFWQAPTKAHPEGRVITVAGGQTLVSPKPNPYGGRYPYTHFACNRVPGRFWADGVVRELEPLQQLHNKALARYFEIMMLSSNPKWVADKDAGLKETSINDQPGEVILKKRGTEVTPVPPPPASTIHPQMMSIAMNAMQGITGVNDPLAGQNPPNVRAGSTVRYLQEAGMRRFTPIALGIERGLRDLGRMLLYLHKRFYDDDRVAHVLGADAQAEVVHMRRADVERIADVTIVHGSMLPKSPAAQQDAAIQLLQYAPFLFLDEQGRMDKEQLLRLLEMPTATGRLGLNRRQRLRAHKEHTDAEAGDPIRVLPFDDDELHLRCHGARLSDDSWVEAHPEAAEALIAHWAAHEAQRAQKQAGAMADIHAAPGPGPDLPTGPKTSATAKRDVEDKKPPASPPSPVTGRQPGAMVGGAP